VSSSASTEFPKLSLVSKQGSSAPDALRPQQGLEAIADEILLELIKGNDRDALSMLFRRYAPTIYNIGLRILRDGSEADDLVQDVFLYLHKKSGLFDFSKGPGRAWIIQVAYTQALLRRRDLMSHVYYASAIADGVVESERESNSQAEYDGTVEGLFGRKTWRRAFASLTTEQQETLRLHFFEGYTFGEIAEKTGQSYGNVRNHHYRGLEKLRGHLEGDD
jgi:RNA polymerase sigma-70 factor (ECF subfamily)